MVEEDYPTRDEFSPLVRSTKSLPIFSRKNSVQFHHVQQLKKNFPPMEGPMPRSVLISLMVAKQVSKSSKIEEHKRRVMNVRNIKIT